MDISEILNHDDQFKYMLLSRMQGDCEYYLGNGNHHNKHLWAIDEAKQIEYMVEIWNSFPDDKKPEWLTFEQINNFATEMGVDFNRVLNQIQSNKAAQALSDFTNMSLHSENSINPNIIEELCNYYNSDTVANLLSDNQKDLLKNYVEMAIDFGDSVSQSLMNVYNNTIHSTNRTVQKEANNRLPEGWHWVHYEDASGYLKSPDGKSYFSYDWSTGEYKITDDRAYEFFLKENLNSGGYSVGSFEEFKKMAESYVLENIVGKEKSSVRNKLEKIKTSDNANPQKHNEKSHDELVADFIAE